jgi:hypothetical protein
MHYFLLTLLLTHGKITHGHFLEKSNCLKAGKDLAKILKKSTYTCKRVFVELQSIKEVL